MQLETFTYCEPHGWSVTPLPAMDSPRTLVVLFGAPSFLDQPEPIETVAAAYPSSQLIGCSTAGEISGDRVQDESLTVAVARFDHTSLATAQANVERAGDSFAAGVTLARQLDGPGLRAVFVLSDGIHVNGSELVRGLNTILSDDVIVTGGLAGDGNRFERTWVLANGRPQSGVIAAAGLYGDRLRVGHGSKGGWDIFGIERVVTHAEGNVLYELDGQPALELYKQYLGDRAADLPASALLFPLALRAGRSDDQQVVRTVLGVDERRQSMIFAGDIPEGYLAQLMKANFDRLLDGASAAAQMSRLMVEVPPPILGVAISCVGRRLVMGELTEEELAATLEMLPAGSQQIGFYSYGELSPLASGRCDLHNQTMTITIFGEML